MRPDKNPHSPNSTVPKEDWMVVRHFRLGDYAAILFGILSFVDMGIIRLLFDTH